jgi:hypothetical protein
METDEQLLGKVPDFISIESMLKATPAEEAGDRFIYLEASQEGRDQQNEVVLCKALQDSAEHFLKFGNLDIDHKSMPSVARQYGITDPEAWEIGQPVDVKFKDGVTFVKARLYSGDTQLAARANMVWDSMTKLNPPARWYPSVGGTVLAKSAKIDPETKEKVAVVTKVRWTNLAISRQPVNQHVGMVATVPFGALAKSWTPDGLNLTKALEAGYGTDSATLEGGGSLRKQSLHGVPANYYEIRDVLSDDLRRGLVGDDPGLKEIAEYCSFKFGLSPDQAADLVKRFARDLNHVLKRR